MSQNFIIEGLLIDEQSIDLTIEPGEIVCLLGPSGSGKTRILRALVDLDPHQGQIRLAGQALEQTPAPRWRQLVGFLPSENHWWHSTMEPHFNQRPPLEALGLSQQQWQQNISQLSTGERQRFALLRLLANQPQALLLDEPTANLDSKNQNQVEDMILNYVKENQTPTLWVTHFDEQAHRIGQRHIKLPLRQR